MRRILAARRAFGLMIVLIMLGVVSMVAASVVMRSQRSLQTSHSQVRRLAGEDAAYSGLQVGLATVETAGDSWLGTDGEVALPNSPDLTYRVLVNSNFNGTAVKVDDDGTEIPPKSVYMKAVGYFEGKAMAGMTSVASQDEGVTFNYPAFGSSSLTFDNSTVDAVDADGNVVPEEAPIRTNGFAEGAVTLSNGSFIDGDVTVGNAADPVAALVATEGSGFSGSANVAGGDIQVPNPVAAYDDTAPTNTGWSISFPPLIDITLPFSTPAPGTYSALRVDSATIGSGGSLPGLDLLGSINILILSDGDYYCSELTTGDMGAFILARPGTRIHVRDRIETAALVNSIATSPWEEPPAEPADPFDTPDLFGLLGVDVGESPLLQVYQTSPGGSVSLQNLMGGCILASQSDISMTGSEFQGALYGNSVSVVDSRLTYPKILDGVALEANVDGTWKLFGVRRMTPAELSGY